MHVIVILFIVVTKLKLITGIDPGFCQRTCGCSNPNSILKSALSYTGSMLPSSISNMPIPSAHGAGFGQPWSPWGSGGSPNSFTKPWRPSNPFIPKGGSRGTFNKPWTAGAPWLQGSKGMADNSYIPRPDSNANIYKTPKKLLPVETRREKMLKPSDGFILMRKGSGSSAYATAGGRKVSGSGGMLGSNKLLNGGAFGNKAGSGLGGGGGAFGNNAVGAGMHGARPGYKPGGSASNSKPGQGGKPGKFGSGGAGGPGNKKGPDGETFIKKDGNVVEF